MSKFILSAFADEICDDLDGQMDALDRHGIKFIELRGVDGKNVSSLTVEEAEGIRRRMEARGFAVSARQARRGHLTRKAYRPRPGCQLAEQSVHPLFTPPPATVVMGSRQSQMYLL